MYASAQLPPATESATPASLESAIREVRDARDIDAALDAYSRGMAIDANSVTLHKAYLRKVIDLDVPQLGKGAAERVVTAEPGNGLAHAVLAYSEARQGQMVDALTDISIAGKRAQAEPFVQRTAAHLLAWYDNHPHPPSLPASVSRSLSDIQSGMASSRAFADAYREASDFYREERQLAAGAATRPSTRPTTGPVASSQNYPQPPAEMPDYGGYTGADIGYTAAPSAPYQPYTVNNYYYDNGYPYYAPYCWSPGYCFWPGIAFVDVFEFDRDHHRRFREDHDADEGFRDRFFGSSHRLGTATGRHLRELQGQLDAGQTSAHQNSIVDNRSLSVMRGTQSPSLHHTPSEIRSIGRGSADGGGGAIYGHTGFVSASHSFSAPPPSQSARSSEGGGSSHSSPAPSPSHSGGGGGGGSSSSSGSSGGGAATHGGAHR